MLQLMLHSQQQSYTFKLGFTIRVQFRIHQGSQKAQVLYIQRNNTDI